MRTLLRIRRPLGYFRCAAGADALAFAPLVDGIILVVGVGVTRRRDLNAALELLPREKIAGLLRNRFHGANRLYGRGQQ